MLLPIEWNFTKVGGPAHGIVTTTVHKTLSGGGEGKVGLVGGGLSVVGRLVCEWDLGGRGSTTCSSYEIDICFT